MNGKSNRNSSPVKQNFNYKHDNSNLSNLSNEQFISFERFKKSQISQELQGCKDSLRYQEQSQGFKQSKCSQSLISESSQEKQENIEGIGQSQSEIIKESSNTAEIENVQVNEIRKFVTGSHYFGRKESPQKKSDYKQYFQSKKNYNVFYGDSNGILDNIMKEEKKNKQKPITKKFTFQQQLKIKKADQKNQEKTKNNNQNSLKKISSYKGIQIKPNQKYFQGQQLYKKSHKKSLSIDTFTHILLQNKTKSVEGFFSDKEQKEEMRKSISSQINEKQLNFESNVQSVPLNKGYGQRLLNLKLKTKDRVSLNLQTSYKVLSPSPQKNLFNPKPNVYSPFFGNTNEKIYNSPKRKKFYPLSGRMNTEGKERFTFQPIKVKKLRDFTLQRKNFIDKFKKLNKQTLQMILNPKSNFTLRKQDYLQNFRQQNSKALAQILSS